MLHHIPKGSLEAQLPLPAAAMSSWSSSLSLTEVSGDTQTLHRTKQRNFLCGTGISTGFTSAVRPFQAENISLVCTTSPSSTSPHTGGEEEEMRPVCCWMWKAKWARKKQECARVTDHAYEVCSILTHRAHPLQPSSPSQRRNPAWTKEQLWLEGGWKQLLLTHRT